MRLPAWLPEPLPPPPPLPQRPSPLHGDTQRWGVTGGPVWLGLGNVHRTAALPPLPPPPPPPAPPPLLLQLLPPRRPASTQISYRGVTPYAEDLLRDHAEGLAHYLPRRLAAASPPPSPPPPSPPPPSPPPPSPP
eukprot:scaffold94915_cov48-Phaeocystis_antarctica.AAC.1